MKALISGKVRDVYEVSDDRLVIVTTDRISAFDVVLPKPVAGKGRVLNAISLFWFGFTTDIVPNHVVSSCPEDMPDYFRRSEFEGRAVLVKKLEILPFEFVVRGYMFGHMWEAYSAGREFCGHKFEVGYKLAERLKRPLLTPSTKAQSGHDEYVTFEDVAEAIGSGLTTQIETVCMKLYEVCGKFAKNRGIIIADTKFEFGLDRQGNLVLADEIFTPDSSRFWSLAGYRQGVSPMSYDKQFVRDWLLNNRLGGKMRFDSVPDDVLRKTSEIYAACKELLCSPDGGVI